MGHPENCNYQKVSQITDNLREGLKKLTASDAKELLL